jgi:hypothetical protein
MRRNSHTFAAGEADPFKLAPLPRRASGGPEESSSQAFVAPAAPVPILPPAAHTAGYAKARFRQQAAAQRFVVEADSSA